MNGHGEKEERPNGDVAGAEDAAAVQRSWAAAFWQQLCALLRKHWLTRSRARQVNVLQLIQAPLFMFVVWVIVRSILQSNRLTPGIQDNPNPPAKPIGGIPDCTSNVYLRRDRACLDFIYSPAGHPFVEDLVRDIRRANPGAAIPEERVRGVSDMWAADDFLLANWGTVLGGLHFVLPDDLAGLQPGDAYNASAVQDVGFVVQTNSTTQWFKGQFQHPNSYAQLPLQLAAESALYRAMTGQHGADGEAHQPFKIALAEFPAPVLVTGNIEGQTAPIFVFASAMFNLVIVLYGVVQERHLGLRSAMRDMGLLDSAYWASWWIAESAYAVLSACLIVALGHAFSFSIFTGNSTALVLPLVVLYYLAVVAFGFLLATLLRKPGATVPVGFVAFFLGWIMIVVVNLFATTGITSLPRAALGVLFAFPWTVLGKSFVDLDEAASGSGASGGLTWANRISYCVSDAPTVDMLAGMDAQGTYVSTQCVLPVGDALWVLAVQAVGFLVLSLYLDNVLPDQFGMRRGLFYFLQPSYWREPEGTARSRAAGRAALRDAGEREAPKDAAVAREEARMQARCRAYCRGPLAPSADDASAGAGRNTAEAPVIELFGLSKEYSVRAKGQRSTMRAVDGTWLGVQSGTCFCLLGHNGAGKTTTISCLTGAIAPSSGDALVHGESILTPALSHIRSAMGVCPQFDVLWATLTGDEHLKLFSAIKGVPRRLWTTEAARLLALVGLERAARQYAGGYSGGMRRRLSVAVALLGSPKVIYLDECTTGMDPVSRRHVWELIHRVKKGRVVILTTHSMEEADVLGDTIAIMARGRIRALGSSLELKGAYGSGFAVSVVLKPPGESGGGGNVAADVGAVVARAMGGLKPTESSARLVRYHVPAGMQSDLHELVRVLEEQPQVNDVQISMAPLEDVFLAVTRRAELEAAQDAGDMADAWLPAVEGVSGDTPGGAAVPGTRVRVRVGEERVRGPDGTVYGLTWGQDEMGQLKLHDVAPLSAQQLSAMQQDPSGGVKDAVAAGGSAAACALPVSSQPPRRDSDTPPASRWWQRAHATSPKVRRGRAGRPPPVRVGTLKQHIPPTASNVAALPIPAPPVPAATPMGERADNRFEDAAVVPDDPPSSPGTPVAQTQRSGALHRMRSATTSSIAGVMRAINGRRIGNVGEGGAAQDVPGEAGPSGP
ncbi:unnamed protein product [Pedinophyceae sp. YPF-701]|nr:unnamed protein product [Pedinophyceae sp. YPF-701]